MDIDERQPRLGKRTVYNQEALAWLEASAQQEGCSFITSLPDLSELPHLSLADWKTWFIRAASLVLEKCPDNGVAIFYQTDLKREGVWVDKSHLCQKAGEATGHRLLWHKVVCRVPAGRVAFGRPSYSHLLCFSRGVIADIAQSTMDVLPQAGDVTWTRGMGTAACLLACRFVLTHTETRTVIDPFCGHGTVLAVANELGLDAVGIELGAKRAKRARALRTAQFRIR